MKQNTYTLTLEETECIKILSDRATGKKHKHKVNKGNKSAMQTPDKQVTIMSKLAMCVARLKAQMCASAA